MFDIVSQHNIVLSVYQTGHLINELATHIL